MKGFLEKYRNISVWLSLFILAMWFVGASDQENRMPCMLLAFLAIIVSVYFICSFIDMIREYIFKKLKVKDRLIKLEHKYLENTWDNIERRG